MTVIVFAAIFLPLIGWICFFVGFVVGVFAIAHPKSPVGAMAQYFDVTMNQSARHYMEKSHDTQTKRKR
jgi:hypothetical protein